MSNYAIITDTDSSLPPDLAARHGIRQVAINLQFGDETVRAVEQLDDAGLFARIGQTGRLPTSSAPTPGQFAEAFRDAFAAGAEGVICFCVSSKGSATFTAAQKACDLFPGREITVIDTYVATMAQGFMVLAAAEAAAVGASKDEIIARAKSVGRRTHMFAALASLHYLALSGRVTGLAASMAELLDIRPVLTMRDGGLDLLERVRTERKSWSRVLDLAAEVAAGCPIEKMAIVHADAPARARRFEALLRERLPCPNEIILADLTPGLSVVSGPGLVGVVIVTQARSSTAGTPSQT
jgi:fatty acid kinase fatty acid binding subunit